MALGPAALFAADRDDTPPDLLIGYTEFRTDLPGGRYVNQATFRAAVVKADGTGRRVLAEELTREKNYWTQFSGWSPDGKSAIFSRTWMSDENGQWEEKHKTFRVQSVHKVSVTTPVGLLLQRQRVIPRSPSRARDGEKSRHRVLLQLSDNR